MNLGKDDISYNRLSDDSVSGYKRNDLGQYLSAAANGVTLKFNEKGYVLDRYGNQIPGQTKPLSLEEQKEPFKLPESNTFQTADGQYFTEINDDGETRYVEMNRDGYLIDINGDVLPGSERQTPADTTFEIVPNDSDDDDADEADEAGSSFAALQLPNITNMSKSIQEAMQTARMTPEIFCTRFLSGNAQETTQQPWRQAVLQMAKNSIIAIDGRPAFGDILYEREDKKVQAKPNILGVVQSVRAIPSSNLLEVQVANPTPVFVAWMKKTTPLAISLQDFSLDLAPKCKNVSAADVVASFVSSSDNKADEKYLQWVQHGADDLGMTKQPVISEYVQCLVAFFTKIMRRHPACPTATGELVDGRCQERLAQAVAEVGETADYAAYSANLKMFENDFATVANAGRAEAWVKECSVFFIVDEPSFKGVQEREKARRMQLSRNADQCAAQFLLRMHRSVFESYLMELNNLWHQPNITLPQVAAVMWLLFYTQLPVFVLRLMQLLTPTETELRRNIATTLPSIVGAFHLELTKHVSNFLPIRSKDNVVQQQLVDNVRTYLVAIEKGVKHQMQRNVKTQTPDCM